MSENIATWEALCRPPVDALKRIGGGRLSGMTDTNPQWRLQMMTKHFGPIGTGWYYEAIDRWTEQGAPLPGVNPQELGELMCFVAINLYVKTGDDWSKPIYGVGGSKLIEKEKVHFYNSDEGYKMATTDALSVAMKELGVGADIYKGLWDGSKYRSVIPASDSATDGAQYAGKQARIDEWLSECEKASMTTAVKFAPWWTTNGAQVKKECGDAAVEVHEAYKTYLARLKAEVAE